MGFLREDGACSAGEASWMGSWEERGQKSNVPSSHMGSPAVRSGLLHLAEALSFRHDLEVVNSTVRAVIATLKSGEKCSVEPELVSKGTS